MNSKNFGGATQSKNKKNKDARVVAQNWDSITVREFTSSYTSVRILDVSLEGNISIPPTHFWVTLDQRNICPPFDSVKIKDCNASGEMKGTLLSLCLR